jgi:murein DD-endopeptidase MepM/ murein hydrolase activator NlpD
MFAVAALATVLLLVIANLDPRYRAGIRYLRPPLRYVMPVTGVQPSAIQSSWHASRSGHRKHEGCDIFAPRGTTVVATTDGVIWAMNQNSLGGNVVYVLGEGMSIYYYAHLDSWAPDLVPGDRVRAGDALGAVGNTGDAQGLPTHLHFGVDRLSVFGSQWIDPAPLLRNATTEPAATLVGGVKHPPATQGPPGGREPLVVHER